MIRVCDHGYDLGNASIFCRGRCGKDSDISITHVITAASDAIHHAVPHNMGGIGLSVDVKFYRRVHRDDSQTTDNPRVVTDIQRSKYQRFPIQFRVFPIHSPDTRGWCKCATGSFCNLAHFDKIKYGILQNFRKHIQILKFRFGKT